MAATTIRVTVLFLLLTTMATTTLSLPFKPFAAPAPFTPRGSSGVPSLYRPAAPHSVADDVSDDVSDLSTGHKLDKPEALCPMNARNTMNARSTMSMMTSISRGGMNLYVKTLSGKTVSIEVESGEAISDIKDRIASMEGIPKDQQRLVFGGVQLADGKTIDDYDLGDDSTIHLVLRLRGGGLMGMPFGGARRVSKEFVEKNVILDESEREIVDNFIRQHREDSKKVKKTRGGSKKNVGKVGEEVEEVFYRIKVVPEKRERIKSLLEERTTANARSGIGSFGSIGSIISSKTTFSANTGGKSGGRLMTPTGKYTRLGYYNNDNGGKLEEAIAKMGLV
jgi:hypothetical protein